MRLPFTIVLVLLPAIACRDATSPATGSDTSTSSSSASTASTADDTGSESGSGSSESSGSESSTTTGPMPCVSDEECTDAAAPFCGVTGECGTCSDTENPDAACAGVDPMAPLCVGGACVACTPENPLVCDEQLLLCDGGTNACVPCVAHEECGSGACELAVGTCFPEDVVVHVDGDGGQDFLTVAAAVASVGDGMHGVIVVHERDGGISYQEATLIDGDKRIALLAAPGEAPILQGTGGAPGLLVEGAGTILYMDGLRVAGNTGGLGLRVDDALAWVDRSRIVQNSGGGVLAEAGAELVLRNCFVGGSVNNVPALDVDGATASVEYTTVIGGLGGTAQGLACTAGSTVTVTDSIVLLESTNAPVTCDDATFEHCVSEVALPGMNNVNGGAYDDQSTWFVSVAGGDFHLAMPPIAIDTAALWSTGDPPTDIDGAPRPTIDGTPDYAGADIP